MQKITVEICCGSADDVYAAADAGADRVELNAALPLGGLTPGIGVLRSAKGAHIPIMAMVRPREGGFCYSSREFESMLLDAHALLDAGADGIVFGILRSDGTVDEERCAKLVKEAVPAQTVFHRAIDVTPDWRAALDTLCSLGIRRVLTSGQAPSAWMGAQTIRQMVGCAAGRIEILPGAGIRLNNVRELIGETGCTQVHASLRTIRRDASCVARPDIRFGGTVPEHEDAFGATDAARVRELVELLSKER